MTENEFLLQEEITVKQQPCEDVISRAEALKVINKMDIPEDMSVFEIKSHICVEISALSPATPKRKVGEGTLGLSKDYCILGLEGIAESEDIT